MYREQIMDHYKNPRHFGHLDNPSVSHHEKNPSCGDEITMELKIEDSNITAVAFSGEGCAICIASTSILSEELVGMKVDELLQLPKDEMLEWIGIPLSTMRVKCGLLGLHTAKKAAYKSLGKQMHGEW